jgi:hypothetical protein
VLDILVVNEQNVFACGEFGLREYTFDDQGGVKDQYSLIEG